MKLYRDLTEGEVLQAGDLYRLRNSDMEWCEHTEEEAAEMPDATVGIIGSDDLEWRRPVELRWTRCVHGLIPTRCGGWRSATPP
jgi:hypothetical protein